MSFSLILSLFLPFCLKTLPAYQLSMMTYPHTSPSERKTKLRCIAWRTRECPELWWREEADVHDNIVFCNISFNTIRTTRIIEFESSQSTSFVALDESLMILCDKVPRHPCQTTTIVPKYREDRESGRKHCKRIISNSSCEDNWSPATASTSHSASPPDNQALQTAVTCLSLDSNSKPK